MNAVMSGLGTVLVLVLALSGTGKLLTPGTAERSISALRLDRWVWRPRLAVVSLAVLELACAGALLVGSGVVYLVAVSAAWAMVVVFFVVGVRAARLGSSDDCGCFGDILPSSVGTAMTLRNLALVVVASLAAGAAIVCFCAGRPTSLLGGGVESVGVALVALLSCGAGAIATVRARRSPRSMIDQCATWATAPALVASDGEVVDPVQRALRGRAQLLVFVRPGCSSCDDVMTAVRSSELGPVEARIVVAAGDGGRVLDGSGGAALVHADPSGVLAQHLGLPDARPSAALVTTGGEVLMPFAVRREQVLELIAAVAAAQASR